VRHFHYFPSNKKNCLQFKFQNKWQKQGLKSGNEPKYFSHIFSFNLSPCISYSGTTHTHTHTHTHINISVCNIFMKKLYSLLLKDLLLISKSKYYNPLQCCQSLSGCV
jgi:hypothetical protein